MPNLTTPKVDITADIPESTEGRNFQLNRIGNGKANGENQYATERS